MVGNTSNVHVRYVLVRSGRDVVGFKILIMGFSANW